MEIGSGHTSARPYYSPTEFWFNIAEVDQIILALLS